MTLHRFFAEGRAGDLQAEAVPLPLSAEDTHHLRDVLRLAPGDEIALVVSGRVLRVRLTLVGHEVSGEVLEEMPAPHLPHVTLVQGLVKGEKMDQIVRQATELGVSRIVPLDAERSVVRLEGAKASARTERWRRIATEAAKQSQRADVPLVAEVAAVQSLEALLGEARVLVCWEDSSSAPGIGEALRGVEGEVAVVVGPEGGLTAHEVASLQAAGAVVVSLGETILRTETAGVVACALVLYELGGLGARHD